MGSVSSNSYISSQDPHRPVNFEETSKTPKFDVFRQAFLNGIAAAKALKERSIQSLNKAENKLDQVSPNWYIQNLYDQTVEQVSAWEQTFVPFNTWLNSNNYTDWHAQLACCLAKLPIRVARNITTLIYSAIKIAISIPSYCLVHPLKAPLKLARIFIELATILTQPEVWTKIGGNLIGSSAGAAIVSGGLLGLIALVIGGALAIGGISIGTLKTALLTQEGQRKEEIRKYLCTQFSQLTESILTGLCISMIVEGIHQVIRAVQQAERDVRYAHDSIKSQVEYINKKANGSTIQANEVNPSSSNYPEIPDELPKNIPDDIPEDIPDTRPDEYSEIAKRAEDIAGKEGINRFGVNGNAIQSHIGEWTWTPPPKPPLPPEIRLNDEMFASTGILAAPRK